MLSFIREIQTSSGVHFVVSIHLMLSFIRKRDKNTNEILKFQYISCYRSSESISDSYVSITVVSIHLMLSFIIVEPETQTGDTGFNTSHVIVHRIKDY